MKVKVETVIILENALAICSKEKELDPSVGYALARNISRTKRITKQFAEDNEERIKIYAKKDDKGELKVTNGQYDFGDKKEEANEKYKELLKYEVDFEPYIIQRSEHTDKLPPIAMSDLLDIIIVGD
jgi:hypothetical protein